MAASSPNLFSEFFVSAPRPVRDFLHAALQLRKLEELYTRSRVQASFSRAVLDLLEVSINVSSLDVGRIPPFGPLVVVANHPFGLLDGLALDAVLLDVRRDVKVLTNSMLCASEEIRERCLPIDVFSSTASLTNLRSVRRTKEWLRDEHGIIVFPAGEVSHWQRQQGCITDPPWSELAARLAIQAKATTIPVYFAGANSLAFHIAGFLHPRLRTVRLPGELLNKRGHTVQVRVGNAIGASQLAKCDSMEAATRYLRARTYILAYRKCASPPVSHESRLPFSARPSPMPVADEVPGVSAEISRLEAEGLKLLEDETYAVYAERGDRIPVLLREIGRIRELTFRAANEGTGKALDLDYFDAYYTQLVLWHKQNSCIAGGYRLAWTKEVLTADGIQGLYTSTLFRFAPAFFDVLGPAVELGRTFIRQEFQKEYAPLMLLWQAIGICIAARPEAPVLFGPVSISANYSDASMELIVHYLRQRRSRDDLARFVKPRRPFRSRLAYAADLRLFANCLNEIEDLSVPLAEINDRNVPVLLRQYLRLGGRVAGFSVDRAFSNVLDGLLVLDLRETSPKLLAKYMPSEWAALSLNRSCSTLAAYTPSRPSSKLPPT